MEKLLTYLKNPVYCQSEKPKISDFIKLYLIFFIFVIPIGAAMFIVTKGFHLVNVLDKLPKTPKNILEVVVFGPILEESIFRSWLRFKKGNVILFLIALLVTSALLFYHSLLPKGRLFDDIFGSVHITIFVGLIILLKFIGRSRIETFIISRFKYFFYGTTIVFGLLHATNYVGNPWIILAFAPILGAPQLIVGSMLGYIRMKHGLVYSMIFHMFFNLMAFLVL